jgi:hypothetical protein
VSIRTTFSSINWIARFGLALALIGAVFGALGAPAAQAAAPRAPQQAAPAAIDSGLVGYWPFDLGNADADLSGSGNTAGFGNGMGLTSTTAPTRFSNTAALLSQNSATSYATAPGNNIDNLQQYTIAFWIRLNSLPQRNMSLVALGSKTVIQYTSAGNGYGFSFSTKSPTFERTIYSRAVQSGVYYHFVATYDDNGMRTYVNGQLQNTLPGLVPVVPGSGMLFSSPGAPLDGILDDVRIYNRGLSAGEIAVLAFHCGGVCEVLQAGWYNITPGTTDATYGRPCYTVTVAPGTAIWTRFGNSTTLPASALAGTTAAEPFNDVIVCAMTATDDAGNTMGPERDPWEEQEQAAEGTIFLPLVRR